jgi:uncharacterized membrane protein YesL
MRFLDSRFYRVAEAATNILLLNLLWLVVSLPLVTLFPATAALFGVLRAWDEQEGVGIARPFFAAFREKFWQSLIVGCAWTAIGGILVVDLLASRRIGGGLSLPLLVATGLMMLAYGLVSIYLFPVIANARTTPLGVIRNAGLLALSQPLLSLLAALALLAAAIIAYSAPIVLVFTGGFVAWCVNALFRHALARFSPVTVPDDNDVVPASVTPGSVRAGSGNEVR